MQPTYTWPALAVVALLVLQVGTAAAQPLPDRPPAGTQLAFVRGGQIYLVNADGAGLIQLTDTGPGIANMDPAWSRDGQRLAFARRTLVGDLPGGEDIYIMDADGSNEVWLTRGSEPVWGPGDRSILFGSGGLAMIDLDAGGSQGTTILLDRPGYNAQPAWSPDGQTITFTSDYRAYDTLYDLYAMGADGACCWPILEGPFFWNDGLRFYFQSAWSPDGQHLAVVSCPYAWDNCYPESAVAIVNSDGSELRELAEAGGYASPSWSPDGQWIAFGSTACRSCPSSIRFARVDGGKEGLLVGDGHSPAWRPDAGALNAPDDPDGPVKDPDEPKLPPRDKLPGCGSKCDTKAKLTRIGAADRNR